MSQCSYPQLCRSLKMCYVSDCCPAITLRSTVDSFRRNPFPWARWKETECSQAKGLYLLGIVDPS